MATGHVDNAPYDRRLPAEEGRISEDPPGNIKREEQVVPVRGMDK